MKTSPITYTVSKTNNGDVCFSAQQEDSRPNDNSHLIYGKICLSKNGSLSTWWDDGLIRRKWLANKKERLFNRIPFSLSSNEATIAFNTPGLNAITYCKVYLSAAKEPTTALLPITWVAAVTLEDRKRNPLSPHPCYSATLEEAQEHLNKIALQSVRSGDHESLRRLADLIQDAQEYVEEANKPTNTNTHVVRAVEEAARKANRVPTQDEVWDEVHHNEITTRKGFDKILARIGFHWLPRNPKALRDWIDAYRSQPIRASYWNNV